MKDSIAHLVVICQDWTRELSFYKSEIPFFKKRLEEIISKNSATDIQVQVEHFENKFRLLDIHFDELLHDVNLKKEALLSNAAEKPTYINIKIVETDDNLLDLVETTMNDFSSTKKSFYQFLSKHL